jgi:hypothetical protein
MSYFAIERNNECWDHVVLRDDNGPTFEEFLNMTYSEMKTSKMLDNFVVAAMDAANNNSKSDDKQTIMTLVGDDNIFIWSIIMGPGENDMIRYNLVDWKKDGKNYRYEPGKSA